MISTKAILLRVFKHGESDLIVHAISQNGDKLKLFARAALKSRRRFGGGVLEPTHFVSLSYKVGRDEGLGQLLEASLIEGFDSLRQNYERLHVALHFIELVERLSLEGSVDAKPLFDLLGNGLSALQVTRDILLLKTQFELKLLHSQGVLPALENAATLLKTSIKDPQPELSAEQAHQLQKEAEILMRQYLNQ